MHYNMQKQRNRAYLEELKNIAHEMPDVYDAINIIQETEWAINKPVYELVNTCLRNNYALGKLPVNPETIELPPKPFDIATNKESLRDYKRQANKVYDLRHQQKSKFIQCNQVLNIAKLYLDKSLYFPHQYDFRWRIYPKPALLNPQGADWSRTLLTFKFGKRIKDSEHHLFIYGANTFGEVDKEDIETRVQWVKDNHDRILSTAKDPLTDTWWNDADKPFAFYAFAKEYEAYAQSGFSKDFLTSLPIQTDCSNSGLQHYSAMMRDEHGGKATNLIPSNKPQDIYGIIAERVIVKLNERRDKLAMQWLSYGIDRKICKKPTMCLPYGLTRYSCREYIEEHVVKELQDRNKQHQFGDDLFRATQYLTPIVWESIGDVVVGAKNIMGFLQEVSRLVASENLPVTWTTPLNAPVQMMNYKMEHKRVKTKMGDSIIKLTVQSETDQIDSRKISQSVAPNYIHSLDASCLQLAVVKAHQEGVDSFSMIHDSFGVVAPETDIMSKAIREAFCHIYQDDVLEKWSNQMYAMLSSKNKSKFPKLPPKGNLKLEQVIDSVFFCI